MTDPAPTPQDVTATFCATLVDELVRGGATRAFVSPGSRSTPMALALLHDRRVTVHVHHDERSGAFAALGAALASGEPSIVLTTSGTATTELHAAVVEAHQARVPMVVLTADRPPELRDVGAPQTIDQQQLFGRAVRWFVDPGVPDWAMREAWRSIASHAVLVATLEPPGPVHVNLPFREPLVGSATDLPTGRPGDRAWHSATNLGTASSGILLDRGRRGLVVAGRGASERAGVLRQVKWPVIADPRAGMDGVVHADAILRVTEVADAIRPDVILRVGEPPASRVLNEWLDSCDARQYVIGDAWIDPGRRASGVVSSFGFTGATVAPRWASTWRRLDRLAGAAIERELGTARAVSEPGVARSVVASVPKGGHLVLASSMPVRDVEWYAPRRTDITVHANRGANGIDGVVSTAIGVAATGAATTVLVGDLAYAHDSSALVALAQRGLDLTIVVVDNDGGGIFSFLPQATTLETADFERLFGTPHGTNCVALAQAHRLKAVEVTTKAALDRALRPARGTRVVVAKSDRATNVDVHRRLNAAVAAAISPRSSRTGE